jgi:hypothetical protein
MSINTYCEVDENGICIGVYHTKKDDFSDENFVITSGADTTWIGTKQWNGNAWNVYTPPVRILSKYEFRQRFSLDEQRAILSASKTDLDIEMYLQTSMIVDEVDLDNPTTSEAIDILIYKELLAPERKAEILT